MIIGYAGGTFDLFHPGHVEFLKQCKRRCDKLVVSVNTDAFARRYKRPTILTTYQRIKMVDSCRYVDETVLNSGDEDSRLSITLARANVIFHGDDWDREGLMKQMNLTEEWLKQRNVTLELVPYTKGVSTTEIIEKIKCL